jgi:hypothetical protein
MEQGAMIKFYFKLRKTATEMYQHLKNVYGDDCLSCVQALQWFVRYQGGGELVEDDSHPGRPFPLSPMKML